MEVGGRLPQNILIVPEAWHKMLALAQVDPKNEVQGLAAVSENELGLVIDHPALVEQEVTGTGADSSEGDFDKSFTELSLANKDRIYACYWHSHNTMDAYFSDTDKRQIDKFLAIGCQRLISLCINVKAQSAVRLDYQFPRVWFDKLDW